MAERRSHGLVGCERSSPDANLPFIFTELGSEAGVLGFLVGLLLDILVSFLFVGLIGFLFWIGVNGLFAISLAVFIPLFYFYRRSLRMIVAQGRSCRGNWSKSLWRAALGTLGYTIWFYGIFLAVQLVEKWRLP